MAFKEVKKRGSLFRPWAGQRAHVPEGPSWRTARKEGMQDAKDKQQDKLRAEWSIAQHRNVSLPSMLPPPELLGHLLPGGLSLSLLHQQPHHSLHHHQQQQHPDLRWTSGGRTKKQRPKRFQCPHCQVSFSNNGQLKGHVRIHTGERPFACDADDCGKTFTRNEELTRHKRIHTGVRPFPCPLCGKRFGRKDHLKKHVRTHSRPHPVPPPSGSACFGAFGLPPPPELLCWSML